MNSPATNSPKQSRYTVLTLAVVLAAALSAPRTNHAQQLQQGVSVQLAVTSNAVPMPEADNADAWIVAVTADGRLYLGIDPVSPPDNLYYDMKSRLHRETKSRPRDPQQKLFIKVDARVPVAYLYRVLAAARALDFDAPVLLTSQAESAVPGTILPPRGLEVRVATSSSARSIVVQVLSSELPSPKVKVNDEDVPWNSCQNTLKKLLAVQAENLIVIKTGGAVPFAQVARVIDLCHSTGATVFLEMPRVQ